MSKFETQEVFDIMKAYFDGDVKKVYAWFNTEQCKLGFRKPIEMVKSRKSSTLLKYVKLLHGGKING